MIPKRRANDKTKKDGSPSNTDSVHSPAHKVLFLFVATVIGAILSVIGYGWVSTLTLPAYTDYSAVISRSYLRAMGIYVVMLLGIFANAAHSTSRSSAPFSMRATIRSSGFVSALLVSPIIFFGVYKIAKDTPDNIVALCLAFQNGFFWKSLLRRST